MIPDIAIFYPIQLLSKQTSQHRRLHVLLAYGEQNEDSGIKLVSEYEF